MLLLTRMTELQETAHAAADMKWQDVDSFHFPQNAVPTTRAHTYSAFGKYSVPLTTFVVVKLQPYSKMDEFVPPPLQSTHNTP
jgi:hypothetical protein